MILNVIGLIYECCNEIVTGRDRFEIWACKRIFSYITITVVLTLYFSK
jgi:hypothetical protein